jgi:hypothetical protein
LMKETGVPEENHRPAASHWLIQYFQIKERDRCGHDRIVVGFTTTYVISANHH